MVTIPTAIPSAATHRYGAPGRTLTLLPTREPQEDCLCLVKLLVRQPRGGDVNAGLETADLVSLPLRFGFGTVRKILADAFTVEPAGDPENDLPAGIREL